MPLQPSPTGATLLYMNTFEICGLDCIKVYDNQSIFKSTNLVTIDRKIKGNPLLITDLPGIRLLLFHIKEVQSETPDLELNWTFSIKERRKLVDVAGWVCGLLNTLVVRSKSL